MRVHARPDTDLLKHNCAPTKHQSTGAWCLVLGGACAGAGAGAWCLVLVACCLVLGAWLFCSRNITVKSNNSFGKSRDPPLATPSTSYYLYDPESGASQSAHALCQSHIVCYLRGRTRLRGDVRTQRSWFEYSRKITALGKFGCVSGLLSCVAAPSFVGQRWSCHSHRHRHRHRHWCWCWRWHWCWCWRWHWCWGIVLVLWWKSVEKNSGFLCGISSRQSRCCQTRWGNCFKLHPDLLGIAGLGGIIFGA